MSGWCTGSAAGPPAQYISDADANETVEKQITYKTVQFPCSRNETTTRKYKVPKQVKRTTMVPVSFSEMKTVPTEVNVTKWRNETVWKDVPKQVPVTKSRNAMREVKKMKKVPVTSWVDIPVQFMEPHVETFSKMENVYTSKPVVTQEKVNCRQICEMNVPITKTRMEERNCYSTEWDTVNEQVVGREQRMCQTTVPVYKVVVKAPGRCEDQPTNNTGVMSRGEFDQGVRSGELQVQPQSQPQPQPRRDPRKPQRSRGNWQ